MEPPLSLDTFSESPSHHEPCQYPLVIGKLTYFAVKYAIEKYTIHQCTSSSHNTKV